MKSITLIIVSICLNLIICQVASAEFNLKPFESDQCTLSPNGWWGQCCTEHDVSYWMGGSQESREIADKRLKHCIKRVDGPAHLYWLGVQIGGGPEGPNEYRWGFGWTKRHYYEELTIEQQALVEFELNMWRLTDDYTQFVKEYKQLQGEDPWW